MHRFVRWLTLMLVVVLLGAVVVLPASAQATQTTYEEGIYVMREWREDVRTGVGVRATKYVNGNSSRTVITFGAYQCAGTVTLPGDPDELEVSNDLGWGGLNTPPLNFRNTPGGLVERCDVEFHLSLYATGRAVWNGSQYVRPTRVQGTITIYLDGSPRRITFGSPLRPGDTETGYTFSTRAPFPD